MWAHNYIVIIGESVASDTITRVIDFFTHSPELRMKTAVVVSKGDAMQYLNIKSGMDDVTALSSENIYSYGYLTAEYIQTDMLNLCRSYYGEFSQQPLISEISFRKSKLKVGEEVSEKMTEQVEFGGSAVFDNDKMRGWLTPDETKGIALVLNKTRDMLVTVSEPSDPNKFASIELMDISADIDTKDSDGQVCVSISFTGNGRIVEEDAPSDLSLNDYKMKVKSLVQEDIVNTVYKSLNKILKDYKCDVVNFGRLFHSQNNKVWESGIGQRWDEIFPQLQVEISAEINILSSTLYQLPEKTIQRN
jgi:spore germination protein KC